MHINIQTSQIKVLDSNNQQTNIQEEQNFSEAMPQRDYTQDEILSKSNFFAETYFTQCKGSNSILQNLQDKESLGQGAFGTVIAAQLENDDKIYAYKIIQYNKDIKQELQNEIKISKMISTIDNIYAVKFYDCFVQFVPEQQQYIIILKIQALKDNLKQQYTIEQNEDEIFLAYTNEPSGYLNFDLQIIYKNFRDLYYSLYQIHKLQISLRDIKPANILADKDLHNLDYQRDQNIKLYLIDFGLASHNQQTGQLTGSKAFIHPQNLIMFPQKIYQKGDVHALSLSYFEIMSMKNEDNNIIHYSQKMHDTNEYQKLNLQTQQGKVTAYIKKIKDKIKNNFLGEYSKVQDFESEFLKIVQKKNNDQIVNQIVEICHYDYNCVIYAGLQKDLAYIPSAETMYQALDICINNMNIKLI